MKNNKKKYELYKPNDWTVTKNNNQKYKFAQAQGHV